MSIGPRILIAGVGNVFFGDDGFGVEAAHRLAQRTWPEGVNVADFGIRARDLSYALLDSYDAVIIIDALARGGTPGTLYVLEPETANLHNEENAAMENFHGMHPASAFRMAAALGGNWGVVRIVGCEPAILGSEDSPVSGLSAPVKSAIDDAIQLVESLVDRIHADHRPKVQ